MPRFLPLILLSLLAACASRRDGETPPAPATAVRLCVANQAAGYGSQVTVRYPGGRFVVVSGAEECQTLRGAGPRIEVRAVSNGGGSGGPLRLGEVIPTGYDACWRWELYDRTTSRLLPCSEAQQR